MQALTVRYVTNTMHLIFSSLSLDGPGKETPKNRADLPTFFWDNKKTMARANHLPRQMSRLVFAIRKRLEYSMVPKDAVKTACNRAIQNIIFEGVSDVAILERPFEIEHLANDEFRKDLQREIVNRVLEGKLDSLKVKPIKHVLIPKKTLADFRNCAVVDIVDEAIFLTIVLTMAKRIEHLRVNKSRNAVFSYRYKYDQKGLLFDPAYSFQSFSSEVNRRKRNPRNKVMVSCDIASYYDRINLHRLNSFLLSSDELDNDIVTLLDQLLLFWSHRNSYGLPVGSNASRILAEAELVEVDNFLLEHDVSFCRYVDDYKIFADTAAKANRDLELLVYALKREGLFLNSGKTSIEDISEMPNRADSPPDHEPESADCRNPKVPVLIAGYSGLIPLKYRKPSQAEREKLKEICIDKQLQAVRQSIILDSKSFRNLVKAMEAQDDYESIAEIVKLTDKSPQFIPYIIDYVKKHSEQTSSENRTRISEHFEPIFLSNETPEFIRIALSNLFSTKDFEQPSLIVRAYLGLRKDSGDYLGRVFLERLAGKTTRLETLELRDKGKSTDINELRALARVVSKGLPSSEARPYLKNLGIHYDDIFISKREF